MFYVLWFILNKNGYVLEESTKIWKTSMFQHTLLKKTQNMFENKLIQTKKSLPLKSSLTSSTENSQTQIQIKPSAPRQNSMQILSQWVYPSENQHDLLKNPPWVKGVYFLLKMLVMILQLFRSDFMFFECSDVTRHLFVTSSQAEVRLEV